SRHPVAESSPSGHDRPKTAFCDRPFDFSEASQPQLVLYPAVLHARLPAQFIESKSRSRVRRHGFFTIDVLACLYGLSDRLCPSSGSLRIKINGIMVIRQQCVQVCGGLANTGASG